MERMNRNDYFMNIARTTAKRSTCGRATVGAIIVKNNRIVATGFNGAPEGMDHCDDHGCLLFNNHCIRTVHAEINCIVQAARMGISIDNSVIYVTHKPCHNCCKAMINAGIKIVYYDIDYSDGFNHLYDSKISIFKHKMEDDCNEKNNFRD